MKKGSETKARLCVANDAIDVPTDSANSGRRSRSTGSIGAAWFFCRRSKAAPAPRASSSSASTVAADARCAAMARPARPAPKLSAASSAAQASKGCPRGALRGSDG